MQAAASEQDGAVMASARAEGFDNATIAGDDSHVFPTQQDIPISSPKISKIDETATISSLEGEEGHVTVPLSSTHVNQEVTSMVSNQEESFRLAATEKSHDGKFVDTTFHDLEENQVAEHAYDMDFDIEAHDMPLEESFFDGNCIFTALDADKTEAWHAGVDEVIMGESSPQLHRNQHPKDVDMKSLPEESNSEPVTMHEAKENVTSNEEWLHNAQQQADRETVSVDALHIEEESSNLHVQGHEELAAHPGNKSDGETLASLVVQDKELACDYSKKEDVREVEVQYDTDDIFASLASENVETIHDHETCEVTRLEEEVTSKITVKQSEFEPTPINVSHEDATVHPHELDHDMSGGRSVFIPATANFNPVLKDVELHVKAGDDSRLDSCIEDEKIVTQVECQGKCTSQVSGYLDFVKKDEYSGLKSNEASVSDQLVSIDSLRAPCTNSSTVVLSGNTKTEHVPVSSEQVESTVVVCREMSMEAASEPFTHEEASTFEQNAMCAKLVVNDSELQCSECVSSRIEADTPRDMELVQNQSDEVVVLDGNTINRVDDGELVRNNDVKEICCGNECVDVCKVAEQEAEALNKGHEQSEEKFMDVFDFSVPEPSKSKSKEICVSGDEIQEGKVAEHTKTQLNEELKLSDGVSVGVFEGGAAEMRKSDVDEIFDSADGIMEGSDQATVAPGKESEDRSPVPLAGTLSLQVEIADEGKVAEHLKTPLNEELKQSDGASMGVLEGSVVEIRKSDVDEIYDSGDGIMGSKIVIPEHGTVAPGEEPEGPLAGNLSLQGESAHEGKVAEHVKKPLNEQLKQSDGASMGAFEGSVAEMRKSDVDEIFHSGDGVMEVKVAVLEQETVAQGEELEDHSSMLLAGASSLQAESAHKSKKQELSGIMEGGVAVPDQEIGKEPEDHSSIPLGGTSSLQAESADESKKQEIHLPNFEPNVCPGTNFTKKLRVLDGSKDNEKSAPVEQSANPSEQCREVRKLSAIAPSKKKSEKLVSDDKLPMAELKNKLNLSTSKQAKEDDHVGDYAHAKCQSEREEESSVKKVQKSVKQGVAFGIGDLVWAKVRSHPWWPAQIFDPADASKSARKAKKAGRVLVAFFGDCTFAWLQQSQMIAFCPNFKEKVQQTTMRIFCLAVEEALEELCRRSELGLSCKHFKGSLHSTSSFPDANTGIREGVRVERFKDIRASAEMFKPKKTLEFVRSVAAAPLGAWGSTLQWAESRGHAYGLRICMVAVQELDMASILQTSPTIPSQGFKLKRSHASLNAGDIGVGGSDSKKAKKLKSHKDEDSEGKGLLAKEVSGEEKKQVSLGNNVGGKSDMKDSRDTGKWNKNRNIIKIKLSKKIKSDHLSSSEKGLDTPSGEDAGGERNSDDSKETLLAIAGHSVKVLKRSSLKEEKISRSSKKAMRRQIEKSQTDNSTHRTVKVSLGEGFSNMDADASLRTGADTEDIFTVFPSPSRDGVKKTEGSKMVEIGLKKEAAIRDNSAGKSESVRKFSKVGDSIRRVASELKGTAAAKVVDDVRHTGRNAKKDMLEDPECQASPICDKVSSKESSEDVSLLQLRRDLELLAKKAGSGGAKGKAVKQTRKSDQVEAVAAKSSPQWQSAPQRSQRSCVQELALAARKRKSEIVHDDVSSKLPKTSSITSSQRHHASKGYITSAEKPGERRSYDKSLLLYSRRPAPPASSMKSSSQRYDEKLSSHAPLGLFMRFPEDFPLPSEAQLKATFIPFGPLQMSATRLYKDSASAQVVFKHGRDAESALKHAKKNPMFGQVAVTYRLRHLSHSTRIEFKTDSPSSNKAHSSQMVALRGSVPPKEKLGGTSALLEKKAGDKEGASSSLRSSGHCDSQSGSEPTGDIQDQMMTLLRQVSVIVNTSPVTSDGS